MIEALKSAHLNITPTTEEWERLCRVLLNKSKNSVTIENEEDNDIPSQKKIYQILLELGSKFNKLEEKVDELNKWVVKKKKKINVIEWLNTNVIPEIKFDNLIEKIVINQDDVKYLFENTFAL
jgi:tRNA(Ser,Leu) C12 N-acetylase TAN1